MDVPEIIAIIVIALLLWMASGPPALILDHVRKFDLRVGDAVFCTLCGMILGPFAWVIWWIEGKNFGAGRVIMRRSERK